MRRLLITAVAIAIAAAACTGADDSTAETTPGDGPVSLDELAPATTGPSAEPTDASPSTTEAAPSATVPDQADLEPNAIIERVVDGDTIIVEINGARERVRLLGIDTPESVAENRPDQCYGQESSDYLSGLLPPGTDVTLIRDVEARDQYDRLLAYVVRSSDQLFINLDLIEQGYAGVLIYEPNSYYRNLFEDAEDSAFAADIGLWGVCGGPDVPLE
ncbi:MAG: thermonuclease family protein [Actinomycetota bacterium]